MDKTSDTARASQGSMTASVDGNAFKAVRVDWDTTGGVIGMEDRERFIYLGFPKDIKEGTYEIGQDDVRAHVSAGYSAEAVSGTLTVQSAGTTNGKIEGKFDFVAKSEVGEIPVTGGRFTVVIGVSTTDQGSGSASAKLDKPLEGNSIIEVKNIAYNGEPTAPTALFATQTEGLQGGLHRLGVIFLLQYDDQDQVSIKQALMAIDYAALPTSELQVSRLDWQSGKHLSFDFTLKFSYNGSDHAIEHGSLKLQF